jgi:hypothetical protein
MNFEVEELSQITGFTLVQASFDDWLWVKINNNTVYMGPYPNSGITSIDLSGSKVLTNAGTYNAELAKSWNQYPNINLLPYLVKGNNTIWTRTIVRGGGESFISMNMQRSCEGYNDPPPPPPPPPPADLEPYNPYEYNPNVQIR